MKVATFGRRCFICEPCREVRQLLDVSDLKKQMPWSNLYKPEANRTPVLNEPVGRSAQLPAKCC
jgi:hypothetical protein